MKWFNKLKSYIKHFTGYKWDIIKESFKTQPYDYGYLLKLEKAKLNEMYHYFKNSNLTYEDSRIAKDIKLAISLLDIIDQTKDTFEFKVTHKTEGCNLIIGGTEYKCLVNVNMRNLKRFIPTNGDDVLYETFPDTLYAEKAKRLYYKLLQERLDTWWN